MKVCQRFAKASGKTRSVAGRDRRNSRQYQRRLAGHHQRRSTLGRPRTVTDAQIEEILTWAASRRTMAQVARQTGVSTTIIAQIIRTGGTHYKQASPEQRTANLVNDHAHRDQLRAAYLL
jgi:transposase